MRLIINGEDKNFSDVSSLQGLIEKLGMKPDRIAVELNGQIIQRSGWRETPLHDGDKLEIVQFVGGGSRARQ